LSQLRKREAGLLANALDSLTEWQQIMRDNEPQQVKSISLYRCKVNFGVDKINFEGIKLIFDIFCCS
jgi:hypothetical protein